VKLKDKLLIPQLHYGLFALDLEHTHGRMEDETNPNDKKNKKVVDSSKLMPKIFRLKNDYSFLPQISPDGQLIATVGHFYLHIFEAFTLSRIAKLVIKSSKYVKMTDNHIFVKHNSPDSDWTVVCLSETKLCSQYKGI
jgi:hypothetical protein